MFDIRCRIRYPYCMFDIRCRIRYRTLASNTQMAMSFYRQKKYCQNGVTMSYTISYVQNPTSYKISYVFSNGLCYPQALHLSRLLLQAMLGTIHLGIVTMSAILLSISLQEAINVSPPPTVQPVPYWTDGRQGLTYRGFTGVLQHILSQFLSHQTAACRGTAFPCCMSGLPPSSQHFMSARWKTFSAVSHSCHAT